MMDTMRSRNGHTQPAFGYSSAPTYDGIQFSDPWARTSAPMSGQIMASSMPQDSGVIPSMSRPLQRNSLSTPFNTMPMTSQRNTSSPALYQTDMYPGGDLMKYNTSYADQPTSVPTTAGNGGYGGMGGYSSSYEQMQSRNNNLYSLQSYNTDRRMSHPSVSSSTFLGSPVEVRQRQNSLVDYPRSQPTSGSYASSVREGSLSDTLDSARGMMALSQTDTRLPMAHSHRNSSVASANSYYPGSTTSSISSTGSYPYFGSMDSSATELSSTDGMFDSARPSLPRPAGMLQGHGLPHQSGAQAMMSTFSSRVSSSTQKKHKCKICDKRFTRPSSLQTHMYSHTGEKPFACDVDGCGRQFSVVSNLRRHRKVHKGIPDMDTCSNASI